MIASRNLGLTTRNEDSESASSREPGGAFLLQPAKWLKDTMSVSSMSNIGRKGTKGSRNTVSRAINNSGYLRRETRERFEKAIAELGYLRNALAASLPFKQTHTLALVLTDITNPFFTTLAWGRV